MIAATDTLNHWTSGKDCYYDPEAKTVIDLIKNGRSQVKGLNLKQIQQRYPKAEIWNYHDAILDVRSAT